MSQRLTLEDLFHGNQRFMRGEASNNDVHIQFDNQSEKPQGFTYKRLVAYNIFQNRRSSCLIALTASADDGPMGDLV